MKIKGYIPFQKTLLNILPKWLDCIILMNTEKMNQYKKSLIITWQKTTEIDNNGSLTC